MTASQFVLQVTGQGLQKMLLVRVVGIDHMDFPGGSVVKNLPAMQEIQF